MNTGSLMRVFCVLAGLFSAITCHASAHVPDVERSHASIAARALPDRTATPGTLDACGQTPQAQRLAALIQSHPLQPRVRLACNPLLAEVAAQKAREMAERGQVTHIFGVLAPNRRLRQAGYALPAQYPGAFHNQVEAVAGGYASAEEALQAFLSSPPHRAHLLAEHPFYAEQDEIAVGYAHNRDSDHIDYWVVYIARRNDSGNPPQQLQAQAETPQKSH